MPDTTSLRDLPLLTPPRSAWPGLQAALPAPRSRIPRRALFAFAAAAALACAVMLPSWMAAPDVASPPALVQAPQPTELQRLQQESAHLEGMIAWARNDAVTLGSIDALSAGLQERVASIDGLLARDELDPEAALPLWQERVLRLRQWLDLETTQQLLAANGDADPGAPVLAF